MICSVVVQLWAWSTRCRSYYLRFYSSTWMKGDLSMMGGKPGNFLVSRLQPAASHVACQTEHAVGVKWRIKSTCNRTELYHRDIWCISAVIIQISPHFCFLGQHKLESSWVSGNTKVNKLSCKRINACFLCFTICISEFKIEGIKGTWTDRFIPWVLSVGVHAPCVNETLNTNFIFPDFESKNVSFSNLESFAGQ